MTEVIKTISKTGTPDYSDPQLWEDDAAILYSDDLVTNTVTYIGEIQEATDNFSGSTNQLTMAGSTTNSLYYKWLRTAGTASFKDNTNVESNALTYNESNGCSISSTVGNNQTVFINESYGRITGLQIRVNNSVYTSHALRITGTGILVEKCIILHDGVSTSGYAVNSTAGPKTRNSLLIQNKAGATGIAVVSSASSLYNCTLVVPDDITNSSYGVTGGYAAATLKNVAVFGATTFENTTSTPVCTSCYSDAASLPAGVTLTTYDTTTGSGFQNINDATQDFRVKDTSVFKTNGTYDASNSPEDIRDLSWGAGDTDVGCWKITASLISGDGTVFDNDAVKAFGIANGYGTQYNDILLNWLRDNYSVTHSTLPDLLSRWIKENGKDLP